MADMLEANSVFGRIAPQQKQAMVTALQARGHVVGMTGDGVNDVLALKEADIGIAMGSGSHAARAAAQLVLLDGNFATLPHMVDEGRRVINNIERVANLFLTKTTYAMLLAIAVGVASLPFPFLPRHLTLVGAVTIGIPGFFLALAPNHRRAHAGFVTRVLQARHPRRLPGRRRDVHRATRWRGSRPRLSLDQARTTATMTLVGIGLLVLAPVGPPAHEVAHDARHLDGRTVRTHPGAAGRPQVLRAVASAAGSCRCRSTDRCDHRRDHGARCLGGGAVPDAVRCAPRGR